MFLKKSFVRFVNLIPGMEHVHPIIHAKEHKFDWMASLNKFFNNANKDAPAFKQKGNTAQCPGINAIIRKGYIVTAPFDFYIKTFGDKENFEWQMNIDPSVLTPNVNRPYIAAHTPEQLHNFSPERSDSLKTIVKVNTYWSVFSSEDIELLQMPIPYPDHNIFSACYGIIDTDNYCDLILQLQWHKLEGEVLIKAGTPLCQLVPIPKNLSVDLRVEKMSGEDVYKSKAYGYLTMHRFTKNFKEWRSKSKKILKG